MDILTRDYPSNIDLIYCSGQIAHPVRREGMGQRWMGDIAILTSCEHLFDKVHENLVQHPSKNVSIIISIEQQLKLSYTFI